jgi:hypothetical protein
MFKLTKLTFANIKTEIEDEVTRLYKKAGEVYSSASPFGQILNVQSAISDLIFKYLENVVTDFNIFKTKSRNALRNLSRIVGHDPGRSMSASGVLRFVLKPGVDISNDIKGSKFTIFNNTLLKNRTNGLDYILKTGKDHITYVVNNASYVFDINIVQGKLQKQKFTSNGQESQSLVVSTRTYDIDQNEYQVLVNGQPWRTTSHIFDMLPDEEACVVNTSYISGIDVVFGNGSFGRIPSTNSIIEVRYLTTSGSIGNIATSRQNDWNILDSAIDGYGDNIDLTQFFDIYMYLPINFGTNGESMEFTRSILPYTSRNFVLAQPENFYYFLKRLGYFSTINAYTTKESDRTIYLYLVPDIKVFITPGTSYFDVAEDIFYLDDYEKNKIMTLLRSNATMVVGTDVVIIDVKLSKYVMFVTLVVFDDVDEKYIRQEIISKASDYFMSFSRIDRIPASDLEREFELIDGVDSVKVQFKSEKNESYHINGQKEYDRLMASQRDKVLVQNKIAVPGYDPNKVIGLDPIMNDIIFEKDEVPIIRGGWMDRDGNKFQSGITEKGFCSVNIYIRPQKSKRTPLNQ